jgi:chromosome segregation protein
VFLKSLTMKGFKSFADTTTLEFEPGVTVVVGPNGSGKSNVVDAVAWVLGAQGPRTVRSQKMEDVIFAGTPSRPALGRAEVALTIDNSAGLLPIDFSEVTITRTLFRTGESEYAINRVPCRLLDIQDLLSDSGVGRQQHVIVAQGNLDAILNARPEERRLVIEEAAGILKFRRRKEKAERRLESTEASLVRLQDLLREVRRQLRPLEKQAEAARRHGDVVAELTAVRRHLFGRDLSAVESRLAACARDRAGLADAETGSRRSLSALDAEVLTAEARMQESFDGERVDLAELVSRAEGLKARAAGMAALVAERKRSVERSLNAIIDQNVIASLEAEAASLSDRLAGTEAQARELLPRADELAEAEDQLAAERAAVDEAWGSEEAPPVDPAAEVRGELGALRSGADRSGAEMRRVEARLTSLQQRSTRLSSEADRLRLALDECSSGSEDLRLKEGSAREDESSASDALRDADQRRRHADAEHHRWSAREEALSQALAQARAQAGAEQLVDVEGVLGTLTELVEVDEGYESAFEAAAGQILSAVVVDGTASARRALSQLHGAGAPGSVVAPSHQPLRERPSAPAGTYPLRAKVSSRLPALDGLLDELFAACVVADGGWEQAVDVAIEHPRLVIVTRAGDRYTQGLWQLGTGGLGATSAALDEARDKATSASHAAVAASNDLDSARHAADHARDRLASVTRALEANDARSRAVQEALARVEAELADTDGELTSTTDQRREIGERVERENARITELEEMLPELRELAAAEAERAAAERAARYRLQELTARVASMRRELEVRAASLDERRTITARRLEEVEERLRRNVAERDAAAERRRDAERVARATDRLLEVVVARESQLDATLSRLREARKAQSDEVRQRSERLEQLRRKRAEAEHELAEIRERINRIEVDDTEARVRMEGLVESIRRELDCEPESVRGAECPELPPGTSATSRRSELERELRLMGPINPLALEEHTALQQRHEFLEAQLEDVRNARRELAKVIRAIDVEIVEVFGAAYADVAENFTNLFATLFPGGEGQLRLTDPDHLLETGIEVEARPSGKNLRRLSLLSGGERSLAAMAFLFAVFRARPSPFYMLDEVEAALDDVNLHRFLDLVHEFRDEAQLLIVSHQKRTMEAADSLYGVTMPPGGSSRVISERIAAPAG